MAVADALAYIRDRMAAACERSGRKPEDVRLMGVSKFHSRERVEEAWNAGITLFGENRVQEASEKFAGSASFAGSHPGAELHLIGSLQRNKAKAVVSLFDCVESVDRDELIVSLGKLSVVRDIPLSILFELNSGEASKSGYPDEDSLFRAAETALAFPSLRIRGLMTMAPFTDDTALIRRAFRALVKVRDRLQSGFPECDWSCLSMGMSGDYEIAIEEGSTLIRIGTAIFGERMP
ncbi:MAG: YggS family pyridoxal phosphate-dependent enzyme [Treponema sp.]|jgi:pyridoxal phosphate enzyme (YggS family)|nr:YggS family pyridoxal phosphate-dependent enzyme [Treponema sp.]